MGISKLFMTNKQMRVLALVTFCMSCSVLIYYGAYVRSLGRLARSDHYSAMKVDPNIYQSNSTVILQNEMFSSQCIAGHLRNTPPMCGVDGCLDIITAPPRKAPEMPPDLKSSLNKIPGWMSNAHINVVQFLSEMQWSYGVYGSVGEIGVYDGRYSSILAFFTALEQGERLFICDIFGKKEHMKLKTEDARRDRFENNMNKVGFSLNAKNESKQIRAWEDSSMYLSKALYKQMRLPAFRFFSIDGSHHGHFVFNDLRHVICVLCKGGIISSDDIKNNKWPEVLQSHKQFFQIFGTNIIKPLLVVGVKLYCCDASWHIKYSTYIEKHTEKYVKVTNNRFGELMTYFVSK